VPSRRPSPTLLLSVRSFFFSNPFLRFHREFLLSLHPADPRTLIMFTGKCNLSFCLSQLQTATQASEAGTGTQLSSLFFSSLSVSDLSFPQMSPRLPALRPSLPALSSTPVTRSTRFPPARTTLEPPARSALLAVPSSSPASRLSPDVPLRLPCT
jgi:hypothetical protein